MFSLIDSHSEKRILEAIRQAESLTSGEIRVHLQRRTGGDPLEPAKTKFEQLGMTRTKERNGILFFIVLGEKKFAVIGDTGIHEKVGDAFWTSIADTMTGFFKTGDLAGGIEAGVLKAGDALATHFPRKSDDVNELPDNLSTG